MIFFFFYRCTSFTGQKKKTKIIIDISGRAQATVRTTIVMYVSLAAVLTQKAPRKIPFFIHYIIGEFWLRP
jgi:hypothetical protein